jgi:LacI family transcriptional regulator
MATIKEVAVLAGVSSATVSHVINGTRYVSDAVRDQVLNAMKELDYRPNDLARSLRSGITHTLGLIIPDSSNPFFAELGHCIENAAFKAGYSVILCNTENDMRKELLYVDVLTKKLVDGMIFVAAGENADIFKSLVDLDIPVVVMDRNYEGLDLELVSSDNHQGGVLATSHLISLGHTRIGCVSGPSKINPSSKRLDGYMEALKSKGLPVDPKYIVQGDFHPESGFDAGIKLLSLPERPTAIFACNDLMAMGVIKAAASMGLRVPEDLALVGYDDIELASYTNPPLSTIKQPKVEMGLTALQIILDRIGNRESGRQKIQLPVSIVVRSSCGGKQ